MIVTLAEVAAGILSAMQDTYDLNATLSQPIKNDVAYHRQAANSRQEIGAITANERKLSQ